MPYALRTLALAKTMHVRPECLLSSEGQEPGGEIRMNRRSPGPMASVVERSGGPERIAERHSRKKSARELRQEEEDNGIRPPLRSYFISDTFWIPRTLLYPNILTKHTQPDSLFHRPPTHSDSGYHSFSTDPSSTPTPSSIAPPLGLLDLPPEILTQILLHLPLLTRASLALTHPTLSRLALRSRALEFHTLHAFCDIERYRREVEALQPAPANFRIRRCGECARYQVYWLSESESARTGVGKGWAERWKPAPAVEGGNFCIRRQGKKGLSNQEWWKRFVCVEREGTMKKATCPECRWLARLKRVEEIG